MRPLDELTDAVLADEYRGHTFAKKRAIDRLAAIEAELERRGTVRAVGTMSLLEKKPNAPGLVDLRRLRTEQPELCARYALGALWAVRTLSEAERAAAAAPTADGRAR